MTPREKRNLATRRWRERNPEKVKEYNAAYHKATYQRDREKILVRVKANYRKNPSKTIARVKQWESKNPGKVQEYRKKHSRENSFLEAIEKTIWVHENRSSVREAKRKWKKANPHKLLADRNARRAKTKVSSAHKTLIDAIYGAARRVSQCLQIRMVVDHITPLALGGAHSPENLVVCPASINGRKGQKLVASLPPKLKAAFLTFLPDQRISPDMVLGD